MSFELQCSAQGSADGRIVIDNPDVQGARPTSP